MIADSARQLIVNADDFGLSPLTNAGIMRCRREGILTSASLMVRSPAAREAVELWRDDGQMSLGLHVELGEWIFSAGEWKTIYEVVPTHDPAGVRDEIYRQLDQFRRLTGTNPTHLDSHQHVHKGPAVGGEMRRLALELGVVLRGADARVRFWGAFFGKNEYLEPKPDNISVAGMLWILEKLDAGVTELSCHPGLDPAIESHYRDERFIEVNTLCDPAVHEAILAGGIKLVSFAASQPGGYIPVNHTTV